MSPERPKAGSLQKVELGSTEAPRHTLRRIAPEPAPEDTTIATHLWTLVEGRWTLLGIAGAVLGLGIAYLVLATPIYVSTVTVQVESRTAQLAGLEELSAIFGQRAPAETEIEIIRSRTLMRSVVTELGLDVRAEPRRFPVVGSAYARRYRGSAPAKPVLGLWGWGWGGERIQVRRLDVSDGLLDTRLTLTAMEGGRYAVEEEEGGLRLQGEVGKVASAADGDRRIELFVSELVAHPGTRFDLTKRRQPDLVDQLVHELDVREKGRNTGIILVSLEGADPARTTALLDALSQAYLRQNVEHKSAEAAKTLEFIESQLPIVKSNLESAQSALNAFQVKKGSVDLSRETTSLLERSVEVDKALQDLELQRAELRQRFTDNHPALTSLNEKAHQLRAERGSLGARLRDIPTAEVDSARMQRDVKSASELYTVLLNKAQELRVVKSGTMGNVRIVDAAVAPRRPARPNRVLVLVIASGLGLAAGIAGVFLWKAFDQGAEDADEIEAETGLPVYVTIPHTPRQSDFSIRDATRDKPLILAALDPRDVAVENVRSLRTSLQFALVESSNNVVAISGPGPGVGKSFVCLNLAWVLATTGHRVLLIDGDLRRGKLHQHLGAARQPGVSDVVSGSVEAAEAIRPTANPDLDVMPRGRTPPNPAELLGSNAFEQLLAWASREYAFVLIDTPPVLAVTDAAVVARLAGVNLLVLRAGLHPVREIALAVKRLTHGGGTVQGAVLNDARVTRGRYGKYGRYQRYEYQSSDTE